MNFISRFAKILTISLPVLFFIGCANDDDNDNIIEGTNSIVNYMDKNPRFARFSKAVDRVGLTNNLDGNSGTYTFFAPNNQAVEAFLETVNLDSLGQLPNAQLEKLVKNHILETLNPAASFNTGYYKTMASIAVTDSTTSNLNVYINTQENLRINGASEIIFADVETDNGIFHEVNQLIKPAFLATFLEVDNNLNAFYQNISSSEIEPTFLNSLQDSTSLKTVFVPNATAVEAFNQDAPTSSDSLEAIYAYHLLDEFQLSTDFRTGYFASVVTENFTGNSYPISRYINTEIGLKINGQSNVVVNDIVALNGVMHVTDAVLKLPSLTTFIKADMQLQTLTEAINRDDQSPEAFFALLAQNDLASSQAPFTIFAPTDNAFEEVLAELYLEQTALIEDIPGDSLTNILKLHIIPESNLQSSAFTNQTLSSLSGQVILDANQETLVDPLERTAEIEAIDVQATNGVLQKLLKVLLP